jgi:ubiquinone/menaquinone biosynthesis C-methylase UbiE
MTSEFLPGVAPGETLDGVRCEDVQELTFSDESFQLCTSTEVFEHVVDDKKGFSEVHRILKAGGKLIFTVPMTVNTLTIERAYLKNGEVVHLLEPEFHGDSYAKSQRVLCFRNYGMDIVSRLKESGFADAVISRPASLMMGYFRWVIVATK